MLTIIHSLILTSGVHVVLKQPALEPDEPNTLDADVDGFDAGLVLLLLLGLGLLEAVAIGSFLFATFLVSTLGILTFR